MDMLDTNVTVSISSIFGYELLTKGHKHKAHDFIKVENEVLLDGMVTLSFCFHLT